MTNYPERPECDFTTHYVGEHTRVWPREQEQQRVRQETLDLINKRIEEHMPFRIQREVKTAIRTLIK
jgi:hypothetical protein